MGPFFQVGLISTGYSPRSMSFSKNEAKTEKSRVRQLSYGML